MTSFENEYNPKILDLHLGRLTPEERRELEMRIQANPALAAEHEALTALFNALNSVRDDVPTPPPDLAARISARVAALGAAPRLIARPRRVAEPAELADVGLIRVRNFRDIAAVAAMIVLAIGVGVPSMLNMRHRAQRALCTEHLAGIGRGLQSYAMANQYNLPFAGWGANRTWRPSDDPALQVWPNRRHIYPLVRAERLPTRVFVCPATRGLAMPQDRVDAYDDFIESNNVTYAYQNMAGVRPSLRDDPDIPILADDNPLFDNGWPLFDRLGLSNRAAANSRAHGGAGQNILTIRGNVRWITNPTVGPRDDNIWTLEGVSEYEGREGPRSPHDAHLLK